MWISGNLSLWLLLDDIGTWLLGIQGSWDVGQGQEKQAVLVADQVQRDHLG